MGLLKHGSHYKKRQLWQRVIGWMLASALAIMLIVGLAGFIFVYATLGKINKSTEAIDEARAQLDIPPPDEPMNILLLGADQDPDGTSRRSDTIMLVRVNPKEESLSMLSMPRDLIVDIPGVGKDKINAAYAIGDISLAIDTVRELTGQPIHHFVVVDFTGFEQAVDTLGGVYVDVDKRYFNDNSDAGWGETYEPIDIYPGYQKLNGHDALAYVRFRHTDSDFMRIARQQYFIRDAKSQSMKWTNLTKVPELANVFASNTTSDIGNNDILSLTKFLLSTERDRIYQAQAPVKDSAGYMTLAQTAFDEVLEKFVDPQFEKPEPAIPGTPPQAPLQTARQLAIEVLNGSGVEGAAAQAAGLLQRKGFEKVTVGGNAISSYTEAQVFYGEGNRAAAGELCKLFKPCASSSMPPELTTTAQLLLAIGSSFDGKLTEKQPEVKPSLHFEDNFSAAWDDWKLAAQELPFPVQKPASFPTEFDYVDFRSYEIETDDGPRPALKVVAENEVGHAWGIMETTFADAPLLENPSVEREISGKNYRFYYAGDKLRHLAWQDGEVVFWITNSLQNSLNEDTMIKLALSFTRV